MVGVSGGTIRVRILQDEERFKDMHISLVFQGGRSESGFCKRIGGHWANAFVRVSGGTIRVRILQDRHVKREDRSTVTVSGGTIRVRILQERADSAPVCG